MRRVFTGSTGAATIAILCVVTTCAGAAQEVVAQPKAPPVTGASPADVDAVRAALDRLKAEFAAVRQQYDERLIALEDQLKRLAGGPRVVDTLPADLARPATPQDANAGALPASAAPAGSSKVFNPDTSVIGNFVGAGGKNPFSTQSPLALSEAEVAFQAVVDPYAKADFFLAAGPEGLEVEEGFITFTSLPSHLLLKVGKMRAQFGKVNTLHTHAMPTADRPLVTDNLLGGEEGISDSGLSLSRLFPNPHLYLEAIGEVYAGRSEVFRTDSRSRLNYVGRVRAYRDVTEDMNLDLGTSLAIGPTEGVMPAEFFDPDAAPASFNKRLVGVDATFRYRPLRRAIYRRFNLRTELFWSRQDLPGAATASAFGMYRLGEYQFARRWYLGGRLDRSGRAFDGTLKDNGASAFLTFWPTEFSQVRAQYRRTNYAEGTNANEVLFQFNFSIGAHGAHAF